MRGWTKQTRRPKSQGACQSVLEKAPRRSGRRPTKAQRRGPGGRKEGQAAEEGRNVQERCVLGQRKARMQQHPRGGPPRGAVAGARERWIRGGEKGRSPQKEPRRRGEKRTPRGTRGPTDQAGPHTATRAEAQGREPKRQRTWTRKKGAASREQQKKKGKERHIGAGPVRAKK